MPLRRRFRLPEIVLGALIGICLSLFAAGVGSYQAEHCEKASKAQVANPNSHDPVETAASKQGENGDHKKPQHAPYFGCGASGLLKSAIGFMDSHEGFFVGFFTFALVVATILLWRATNDLYDAGERQIAVVEKSAEALPKLERAYVFLRIKRQGVRINGDFFEQAALDFVICNYGKTPAILKSVDVRLVVSTADPDNTIHDPLWQGYVLKVGEEWEAEGSGMVLDDADLPFDIQMAYRLGHASLWFYGSIIYEDIMGAEHITRGRYRYSESVDRFDRDGGKPYNETT